MPYAIGTEEVKGFALTLIIGNDPGTFTAVYVSRVIFDFWYQNGWMKHLDDEAVDRDATLTSSASLHKILMTALVWAIAGWPGLELFGSLKSLMKYRLHPADAGGMIETFPGLSIKMARIISASRPSSLAQGRSGYYCFTTR